MAIFTKSSPEITATSTFFPLQFVQQYLSGATPTDKKLIELYLTVPELQAIGNYKARVFSGMNVKAFRDEEEVAIPQLDLFKQPNPLQSFREFATQYYILRFIFGNEFIHPVFGSKPDQTQAMWNLPSFGAEVVPVETKQIPFNMTKLDEIIKEYKFSFNSQKITYQPNEIIHFNDNQIQFDDDKFLLGESKLRPLVQACENIKNAYEARGVLIQNSALGILTNDSTDQLGAKPLDPGDKSLLHEDYKKYGLTKAKWQLIITNASLKWQSMATDTGKLKLFEEVDADYRTIAGAYAFPPELLQPKSGSSLNQESKSESLKQLYQDAIIPEADQWLQGIANFMGLDVTLKSDFSHIAVLQADITLRSKSMQQASIALSKAIEAGIISQADATEQFKKYLL